MVLTLLMYGDMPCIVHCGIRVWGFNESEKDQHRGTEDHGFKVIGSILQKKSLQEAYKVLPDEEGC
jgi:hypothetical protein